MSEWQFEAKDLTIKNKSHGAWELRLRECKSHSELLRWILQAAQHDFDMAELFEAFAEAIGHCFGKDGSNGAALLNEIYFPALGNQPSVIDWTTGKIK